ncbi:MAG: insulinase family protein [Bacteroidota bacterium]|nr:insulinase family protein [Bacteroidota bacterium]MDP4232361.1 insulinase family protein [Bacteroidota bacterium]MDP4241498.1 insulinase family protein [Bacteroidota bacterium]MDP4289004.1 insulinase family protein [Bacteroidota bacterium]
MKKPTLLFGILLSVVLSGITHAQSASMALTDTLPLNPKVHAGVLANGLHYYILQNGKPEHRLEARLVVRAGSILEDDDQQGLAHLNEHMAFNGTKKFPHNALPSFLEAHGIRFGAHLNAYTSYDETVYMLELPTDKPTLVDTGIDILAEWAHNLLFDSLEVEKERGVVGEEWRLGLGANQRIGDKELPVVMYGSRFADRKTIGKKEIIDTAHQNRISQFYKDWYRPDLMSVVVVGDFDPAAMEARIKSEFGGMTNPNPERPRTEYEIPPHSETLVAVNTDKEMTNSRVRVHFMHPGHDELVVSDYRTHLVGQLYDQMFAERLSDMIQQGGLPLTGAYAYDTRQTPAMRDYVIIGSLKPDSIGQGVSGLLREVYRAKQTGFAQTELDRVKKNMMSGIEGAYKEREKTNSSVYAGELVRHVLDRESAPGITYEYELTKQYLPGITLAEVNAAGQARFEHASTVLTYAGPANTTATPTEAMLRSALHDAQTAPLAAYVDNASNMPLIATKPKPGKIVSESRIAEIGVTEWKLSNGARVILKPTDFKDDEILFRAIAPGGTSLASDANALDAALGTMVATAGGLGKLDEISLQKQLAGKELRLNPFASDVAHGLTGESSRKDIETLFQLAYLYESAPRFDSAMAAGAISRTAAMYQNRGKNPQAAFMDTIQVTMSQYNARDLPLTAERLKDVNIRKSFDYYRERFEDGGNFTYFMVGSFSEKEIRPFVEEYLASVPSRAKHETWRDNGIEPPAGVIKKTVRKGMAQKSSVQIIFTGPFHYTRSNRTKLSVMTQSLAIKLREDLREDKSGVYGIGVRGTPSKYPKERYQLTISFGCDPKRADELIAEVMKQIDTITTRGIDPIYLSNVKETSKTEYETQIKENDYWLNHLVTWARYGDDPKAILGVKSEIDAITQDDVFQAAKQYLNTKHYVQVVLYPEKS